LRAVDQSQPFFGRKAHRRNAFRFQNVLCGDQLAIEVGVPLPYQYQGQMRQWSEVAASSHRALRWDMGDDAGVHDVQERLHGLGTYSGITACKRRRSQNNHGAHHLFRQRRSHPDAVADYEIVLQEFKRLIRNHSVGKLPESGCDSVHNASLGNQPVNS